MATDTELEKGIAVILRGCWELPSTISDDELKGYAAKLLKGFKAGESEVALHKTVADIQLAIGVPGNQSYKEVAARIQDMIQKNSN
jgi:hypothetical protein